MFKKNVFGEEERVWEDLEVREKVGNFEKEKGVFRV